ncbi:MAG: isoleucine--tRNA ligase [candidate division WOR-3 bacterium]|nr:isoleucine--tRNA ligase [candidate division WOR-3 bacterium]MDH5682911.1 isoleucine--tRNA ligase [candidate division WOR-3 bacterium]
MSKKFHKNQENSNGFQPVPPKPNFPEIEHRILEFWEKSKHFEKLRAKNKGKKKFSFLDGPITANNPMGVHHAWGRTYKDLFQRFYAMLGYDQRYQNGFDCQGLWVEVEVERELDFKSKRDIEQFGIDKFVEKCKERVLKYSAIQTKQSIRLGQWMDWDNSYYTMSDENNYTIWYFLKKCYEHGWIYKGTDVMPWCARCGTALSEHEIVTEGYRELTHPGLYLRFPIIGKEKEYLFVWTTTPWTLTSNVAAAVHPEIIYVKVKKDDAIYYLAKSRLPILFEKPYEVLAEIPGKELVGLTYQGPFDELEAQAGVIHRVVAWDEVSETDGSGIVHIAPGCGKEDFELGKIENLAVIAPLDENGYFLPKFNWLTGKNVKEVNEAIFKDLERKRILHKVEDYTHRYPVCWRCDSELVFRLVDEWFIKMDELRFQIMESAKQVRWIPEFGLERELDWLTNMQDWCISKKRYWGLALPIYQCNCGHFEVIGGKEELKSKAVEGWDKFEGHTPHRPWIDEVKIKCPKCGAKTQRIPEVGNPWLDAGIVPFSTTRYLTDNKYWQAWFPFDFITECFPGQFRNWFYAILAMSTVLEGKTPFRTLLGHALVKDEKGEDMHKSAGNVIWIEEAAEKMGADVMRWIFIGQNPTINLNFGYTVARETTRKLLTLWNVYSFFITYARIDKPQIGTDKPQMSTDKTLSVLDRWIISRLNSMIKLVRERLMDYDPVPTIREIERFIDDMSLWYVRRNRRRFWKSEDDKDKLTGYHTLYECLMKLVKLIAPYMPFLAEELYQNLVVSVDKKQPESVHLCDYPDSDTTLIDNKLEAEVALVRELVSLGHAAREKAKIKVRQPLSKATVFAPKTNDNKLLEPYINVIKDELNVKEIELLEVDREAPQVAKYSIEIDTRLTPELENEGFSRELVHKVQNLRKEAGFEVTDRIRLYYKTSSRLETAIQAFKSYIQNEILATELLEADREVPQADLTKDLRINGEPAKLTLSKIRR